jgi:DnaJ-class molecular chaperone
LPPGDLYINVLIRDEINWGRQGDDLYVNIVIDALDAIVGCDTIVKHINGKQFKVKIPAGTQEQERVRLVGQGMPHPSSGEVGALYAIINIEVPNILDKEIITLLNTIREKRGNNGS